MADYHTDEYIITSMITFFIVFILLAIPNIRGIILKQIVFIIFIIITGVCFGLLMVRLNKNGFKCFNRHKWKYLTIKHRICKKCNRCQNKSSNTWINEYDVNDFLLCMDNDMKSITKEHEKINKIRKKYGLQKQKELVGGKKMGILDHMEDNWWKYLAAIVIGWFLKDNRTVKKLLNKARSEVTSLLDDEEKTPKKRRR